MINPSPMAENPIQEAAAMEQETLGPSPLALLHTTAEEITTMSKSDQAALPSAVEEQTSCKGDRRANTTSDELAGDPKGFSHYVVMLNTCIPSRGSKEERIRIPLLAWPNIHSK